ncbi:helix-turn-helix domain-containing protein [Inquilinus sp. CAU 1745]|uniref:helix-turn-helix domain-containing protein n=1 Tax=Inquilinus sp. CAU 1745 TaxID=3140369 RepID=UPI00325AA889
MPDDVQEIALGGKGSFMSASGQDSLHEFSQGRPYGYIFQTVSSEAAPPPERYDYWTGSLVRGLQVDRPNERQARDFRATATSLASLSGEMHLVRTDGFAGTRTPGHIRADQSDEMALHLIVEGKLTGQYEGDSEIVAEAGDFFLVDVARPLRLAIEGCSSLIQIDLPRSLMESIFPVRIPPPSSVAKALAASSLTPLLRAHLLQLSRAVSGMNAAERLTMLDASEAFVIATIEGAFAGTAVPGKTGNEGLFMAAQRYIRAHLGRHNLNPSEIAAAVGCSRATLYRLFQGHGLTVSGHIRELRLQRLMRLLQRTSDGALVAVLAYRCGFHDIPNVNQMFRRRFGVSPTQARAMSTRQ